MQPEKDFFVGMDSDGCVFNSMELKQKKCLLPGIVENWNLQPIREYVMETGEFVNLYSQWRGTNRFVALAMVFDLLSKRDEVKKRKIEIPNPEPLKEWLKKGTKLSNATLKIAIERTGNSFLRQTLKWSEKANEAIADISKDISPFSFIKEALKKLQKKADIVVVSATPEKALRAEWQAHGIMQYARAVCGQELGSKKEHIALAAGGKYKKGHMLMLGDAPGDFKAAKENDALFYPIIPAKENKSWEKFYNEAMDKFFNEEYAGKYESELIGEFEGHLPSVPPWGG
ncbi:MAG: HAD hydrolase-like protein [Candidatus Ratteibacteria bacterium]|nr:HAD hydrolase-like protein [Candidatus Ratteibacteria bacterium]